MTKNEDLKAPLTPFGEAVEHLEALYRNHLRTLKLKQSEADKGNDWVVAHTTFADREMKMLKTLLDVATYPRHTVTDTAMEDAVTREDTVKKTFAEHGEPSSTTDGAAERALGDLKREVRQVLNGHDCDDDSYDAGWNAAIDKCIKALQSTRKPPVDTISVPREVFQGVRDALKRVLIMERMASNPKDYPEAGEYARKSLASLDAVLSEGE